MIKITKKANVSKLIQSRVRSKEKALDKIAQAQITRIRVRTAKGVNYNEKRFISYTKPYARKRAKSGRQTSPPNLNYTGSLMRSLRVLKITNTGKKLVAAIGFSRRKEINKMLGLQSGKRKRLFFKVSKRDKKLIKEGIDKA